MLHVLPLAPRRVADKFYYLAKEQGFRSRASFKLIQLNRKYDFFSGARACMDLCAAPGGWLQVAVKYMPMSSTIVGVDLAPIKPIRGCTTFVDDITTQSCRAQLKRCTPEGVKYDVVMHDGAPNVGGNYAAEAYTQAALTLDSLRLATEFLREGGWFVTKVFRSTEYHALLYSMQQLFQKVESNKPQASRGTSAEIFVVCQGYLAPAKIDPRLLDPRHLFAEYDGPKQAIDVLSHQKQKRNRSGYEDGVTTLYKECPAEAFIHSDKPTELLGQYHVFLIDASVSLRDDARAHGIDGKESGRPGRVSRAIVPWVREMSARWGLKQKKELADEDRIFSQFVRWVSARLKTFFANTRGLRVAHALSFLPLCTNIVLVCVPFRRIS